LYIVLFGRRLLPQRQMLAETLPDPSQRRFLTEVMVPPGSPPAGRTLAALDPLLKGGAELVCLIRDNSMTSELPRDTVLAADDRLVLRTGQGDILGLRESAAYGFDGATEPGAQGVQKLASAPAVIMEGIV